MTGPTVEELLARLVAQQQQIDELRHMLIDSGHGPDELAGTHSDHLSRKAMLTAAAAGAVGVLGTGTLLSGVRNAEAATRGGTQPPTSFASSSGTPAVTASNSKSGPAISASSAQGDSVMGTQDSTAANATALHGVVKSTKPGTGSAAVRGTNDGTNVNGAGVAGTHAGGGKGVSGTSVSGAGVQGASSSGTGVNGVSASTKSNASAILGTLTGKNPGAGSAGVRGVSDGTTGEGAGVVGISASGIGVSGISSAIGVSGAATGKNGVGVLGSDTSTDGTGVGVKATSAVGKGLDATSGSTAGGAAAILGTITSTAPGGSSAGVVGENYGTGGLGIGVYGVQNGSGWGVYGTTPSGIGVYGYSSGGTGVRGGSSSGTGLYAVSSSGVGVQGSSYSNTGVAGSSTSGTGVNGSSTSGYGVYGSSPDNYGVIGLTTSGNGVYGQASVEYQGGVVGRQMDGSGDWAIYGFGNIGASGTKSAVVPAADGKGHLTLYCMESPECWFEDFGSENLANGTAKVKIDPVFAQTIHTGEYYVFLEAEGDSAGLYVAGKTSTGFTVRESSRGESNIRFSYRIVGRRKDVEAPRLRRATMPDSHVVEPSAHAPTKDHAQGTLPPTQPGGRD